MLVTIVSFLAILGVLVFVHELGHFLVAKWARIRVLEFGFGYPPRLLTLFRHKGTEYTLNLLPIGGFVRMLGEEDPSHPESLAAQPPPVRAAVLLAGPMMNIWLAVLLFALLGVVGVPAGPFTGRVEVVGVAEGSPAAEAGLEVGDVLLYVAGQRVSHTQQVQAIVLKFLERPMSITVEREGELIDVTLTPRADPPRRQGWLGVEIINQRAMVRYDPLRAILFGLRETGRVVRLIVQGVAQIIEGTARTDVAGPIGIAQVTGELAREGRFITLVNFAAFLSVNLAILNLLPFPALDGGRLLFVLVEWARGGKRVDPQKEGLVHFIGMIVLLSLMLFITYFDVLRLFSGESIIR
ncbi:MAG: RIP metalloprotease RseP [Ardenticatenia bacterium]|nr:RIP metalloprotease RseP [Ardenticatenia bacterium]